MNAEFNPQAARAQAVPYLISNEIPAALRQRVFGRFERLGLQDDRGVGLGLSIVQSVVEAHRATIHLLDSPLGGLRVEVRFHAAAVQAEPWRERAST